MSSNSRSSIVNRGYNNSKKSRDKVVRKAWTGGGTENNVKVGDGLENIDKEKKGPSS